MGFKPVVALQLELPQHLIYPAAFDRGYWLLRFALGVLVLQVSETLSIPVTLMEG